MTVRNARVGTGNASETITDADIGEAIDEFARRQSPPMSLKDARNLVLSHTTDRTSALGWARGLAKVMHELALARKSGDMVREYEVLFPAYAADGTKLALTVPAGNADTPADSHQPLSDEDAAAEAARILGDAALSKANRSISARLAASSASVPAFGGATGIGLSRPSQSQRLYDDDSELQLTAAPVGDDQAALDAYLVHLSRSGKDGARALGLAQGNAPAVDDVSEPTVSDVSQETTYSPYVEPRVCDTGHLVTDSAAKFCPECGAELAEPDDDDTASVGQNPADADRQSAPGYDAASEVERLSRMNLEVNNSGSVRLPPTAQQRSAHAFATSDRAGTVVNTPKSLTQRNAEEQYSGRPAQIRA